MKLFKRFFAGVLLAAMVLTVLTGCQSNAAKAQDVYNTLQTALGENQKITVDDTLQKKADAFTATFLKGENLESNQSAGRAYAKVKYADLTKADEASAAKREGLSEDQAAFWDILTNQDKDVQCIVPVWYSKGNEGMVNAGLLLPYNNDRIVLSQMLYQTGVVSSLQKGQYTKVGISVVNVKGDDYVVILAAK